MRTCNFNLTNTFSQFICILNTFYFVPFIWLQIENFSIFSVFFFSFVSNFILLSFFFHLILHFLLVLEVGGGAKSVQLNCENENFPHLCMCVNLWIFFIYISPKQSQNVRRKKTKKMKRDNRMIKNICMNGIHKLEKLEKKSNRKIYVR